MRTAHTLTSLRRHGCHPILRQSLVIVIATLWLSRAALTWAGDIQIKLVGQGNKRHIAILGLTKDELKTASDLETDRLAELVQLRIDLGKPATQNSPTMLGEVRVGKSAITFHPRFPLRDGQTYRLTFKRSNQTTITHNVLTPRGKPASPGAVSQIYPTASVLPENLLKFYIHFSKPMSRGEAYNRIALYDSKGKKIADPFLELGEELWDRSGKRFTLFFDPGRIKRGLKPRDDVGPVLEEGQSYTLVVDRNWRTAAGAKLKAAFRKSFKIGPPDDVQPNPKRWKLQKPTPGTRQLLSVRFAEPLDHAMLHRVIAVVDGNGKELQGSISVHNHEMRWAFTPKKAWRTGEYRLQVATNLEDRSGNSIGRPFEVDVTRKNSKRIMQKFTTLRFTVSPAQ